MQSLRSLFEGDILKNMDKGDNLNYLHYHLRNNCLAKRLKNDFVLVIKRSLWNVLRINLSTITGEIIRSVNRQ